MRPTIAVIILGMLAAIILIVWGSVLNPLPTEVGSQKSEVREPVTAPSITFVDPIRGPRDARVKIIEYADFSCSACQAVKTTLDTVLAAHPNEVALIWKYAPDAGLHAAADRIAEAAACAAREGKFWEVHDALFAAEGALTLENAVSSGVAAGLGTTYRACVEGRETKPLVDRSLEEARALGIASTPYFFIGQARIDGAPSQAELEAILTRALQK